MGENYQIRLDKEIERIVAIGKRPRLLLHVCCAPCSSYVLEYLNRYFDITACFYNPNISPKSEYDYRAQELIRLSQEMPFPHPIQCRIETYDPDSFHTISRGLEAEPEGGARCTACYRLRLEQAAKIAAAEGYDYFTTTLSISPLKDAVRLNTIGSELSEQYGIPYLYSDFKKREGYKRSIQLSIVKITVAVLFQRQKPLAAIQQNSGCKPRGFVLYLSTIRRRGGMADTLVLGASAYACGFKSRRLHQDKRVADWLLSYLFIAVHLVPIDSHKLHSPTYTEKGQHYFSRKETVE